MKISTLRLPLALLTFFATSSAFAMSPMLERILAGIDTVPNHAELFMALDFPVAELESAAADDDAPLYHRIRATSFLSTLNAEGGRDALLRLCESNNSEIRRHAVYGFLRSTQGPLRHRLDERWMQCSPVIPRRCAKISFVGSAGVKIHVAPSGLPV